MYRQEEIFARKRVALGAGQADWRSQPPVRATFGSGVLWSIEETTNIPQGSTIARCLQ
jgi:hypothetical protein